MCMWIVEHIKPILKQIFNRGYNRPPYTNRLIVKFPIFTVVIGGAAHCNIHQLGINKYFKLFKLYCVRINSNLKFSHIFQIFYILVSIFSIEIVLNKVLIQLLIPFYHSNIKWLMLRAASNFQTAYVMNSFADLCFTTY